MPPFGSTADALIVGLETLTLANQRLIVDLAAHHRLPAMYASESISADCSPTA